MALIYSQNFNALNTADLNGQDSWVADASFDVQESVTYEGAKAVSHVTGDSQAAYRDFTAQSKGIATIYVRTTSTSVNFDVVMMSGGSSIHLCWILWWECWHLGHYRLF